MAEANATDDYDRSALFPLIERKRRAQASEQQRHPTDRMFDLAVIAIQHVFSSFHLPPTFRDGAPHLLNFKWIMGEYGSDDSEAVLVRVISELARQGIITAAAPFMRGSSWFVLTGQDVSAASEDSPFGPNVFGLHLRHWIRLWTERRIMYIIRDLDSKIGAALTNGSTAIQIACTEDDQMLLGELARQLQAKKLQFDVEFSSEFRRSFGTDDDVSFQLILTRKAALPKLIAGVRDVRCNSDWRHRVCLYGIHTWRDARPIYDVLRGYSPNDTLVICRGSNHGLYTMIIQTAKKLGFFTRTRPLTHEEISMPVGRGYVAANLAMIEAGEPTHCVLFYRDYCPMHVSVIVDWCREKQVLCDIYTEEKVKILK